MILKRLIPTLMAASVTLLPLASQAQTVPVTTIGAPVPTTHVLAIGSIVGDADPARQGIMPAEVKATVGLYLAGKIDQWWVRKDGKGVVFLLNAASAEDGEALLAPLPLVKGGRLKFDLMPLGPLRPLQFLTDGVGG
jgi:hypothetical protein